jgi:hypothetical protein
VFRHLINDPLFRLIVGTYEIVWELFFLFLVVPLDVQVYSTHLFSVSVYLFFISSFYLPIFFKRFDTMVWWKPIKSTTERKTLLLEALKVCNICTLMVIKDLAHFFRTLTVLW